MRIVLIVLILAGCFVQPLSAQQERKYIREGNTLFGGQEFEKSEVEYRKALDKEDLSFEAAFNLGDALYKQKKYEEALRQFSGLAKRETDKKRLGEIYHNIGNTLLGMQKTAESVDAYKESLRNRPVSQETKYNLEYARQQQQQEQNQDKNQDQENKEEQNQEQDQQQQQNQNREKEQNQQQQQDKQQQNQEQRQEEQQPREEEAKISKEDAKRLLDALQSDEKRVQEKVQKEKAEQQKAKQMKIEKNW